MRRIAATALLGSACALWAALPLTGTGAPGVLLLAGGATGVLGGTLRLLTRDGPLRDEAAFSTPKSAISATLRSLLQRTGWESLAVLAVVGLEAVHHSRPWHTGLLAVLTMSYLVAVHETESPVPPDIVRKQVPAIVIGLPLVAAATGVAMLPAVGSGTASGPLEILSALAAIAAGVLAIPLSTAAGRNK